MNVHRQFEASAVELTRRREADLESGRAAAEAEIDALSNLAGAIGRGLSDWRARTAALELIRPFDIRRAGSLVLESVFDEILAPEAWRVLADAFTLVDPDQGGETRRDPHHAP